MVKLYQEYIHTYPSTKSNRCYFTQIMYFSSKNCIFNLIIKFIAVQNNIRRERELSAICILMLVSLFHTFYQEVHQEVY